MERIDRYHEDDNYTPEPDHRLKYSIVVEYNIEHRFLSQWAIDQLEKLK